MFFLSNVISLSIFLSKNWSYFGFILICCIYCLVPFVPEISVLPFNHVFSNMYSITSLAHPTRCICFIRTNVPLSFMEDYSDVIVEEYLLGPCMAPTALLSSSLTQTMMSPNMDSELCIRLIQFNRY